MEGTGMKAAMVSWDIDTVMPAHPNSAYFSEYRHPSCIFILQSKFGWIQVQDKRERLCGMIPVAIVGSIHPMILYLYTVKCTGKVRSSGKWKVWRTYLVSSHIPINNNDSNLSQVNRWLTTSTRLLSGKVRFWSMMLFSRVDGQTAILQASICLEVKQVVARNGISEAGVMRLVRLLSSSPSLELRSRHRITRAVLL